MNARPLNPFAMVEQSINAGVVSMLSNAVAAFNGGEPFGVMFDQQASEFMGGDTVDVAQCTCSMDVAAYAPDLAEGSTLSIDGVQWQVSGGVLPDSSGWATFPVMPVAGQGGF